MKGGNFKVTLTDDRGEHDPSRSFEMSDIELEAYFPKEIKVLQNSPCSAVSVTNKNGSGAVIIEKLKAD